MQLLPRVVKTGKKFLPGSHVEETFKVAQNSNIFVRSLGSNVHFSARHHAITQGVTRQHGRLQNTDKKMVVRGLLHRTSSFLCSFYQAILTWYLWYSFSPLILLTATAKQKILFTGIHVYSRGIAGFTEQWTAFTHAQS